MTAGDPALWCRTRSRVRQFGAIKSQSRKISDIWSTFHQANKSIRCAKRNACLSHQMQLLSVSTKFISVQCPSVRQCLETLCRYAKSCAQRLRSTSSVNEIFLALNVPTKMKCPAFSPTSVSKQHYLAISPKKSKDP